MSNSSFYNFSSTLNQEELRPGLYIVATPIGNLEDISFRALKVLASVECVFCEDTTHSKRLFKHYGITQNLATYHDFTRKAVREKIVSQLQNQQAIALISDAGTPLISDPGYKLVAACYEANLPVIPVPGPSAVTGALCASGLPTDQFFFYGFLPKKAKECVAAFEQMQAMQTTIICYETSKRLVSSLEKMHQFFSDEFEVCVAREITKKFETFKKASLAGLLDFYSNHPPKGEIVMIFNTRQIAATIPEDNLIQMIKTYEPHFSTKEIAADLAKKTSHSRRDLYNLILKHHP